MSSLTSSPRPGGAARSRSSADGAAPREPELSSNMGRRAWILLPLIAALSCVTPASAPDGQSAAEIESNKDISRAAADRCAEKFKKIEDFTALKKSGRKRTTRISEQEINSYLELDLKKKYHPCLKSFSAAFEEDKLQGIAFIDFDRLGAASSGPLQKMVGVLFSGTHTLKFRGRLIAEEGKAHFELERAFFDDSELPKFLVEEIISAVGRRQNPPFDPLKPSKMPYEIERVDVRRGYVEIYQ